jgi:O-antigen biosynthesis protein WbqV
MREVMRRARIVALACFTYDVAAFAGSMFVAMLLGHLPGPSDIAAPPQVAASAAGVYAALGAVAVLLLNLHRRVWRYVTLTDIGAVAQAVVGATLVFFPVLFVLGLLDEIPLSAPFFAAGATFLLIAGARLVRRWSVEGDFKAAFRFVDTKAPPAIIVGSAHGAATALTAAGRRKGGLGFRPLAIVEPTGHLAGRTIQGVPVLGGLDQLDGALAAAARAGEGPRLILTADFTDRAGVEAALAAASRTHAVTGRLLPEINGEVLAAVEPADLLGRPQRRLSPGPILDMVAGKRVLVTGAGGTIGSELARQIAEAGPAYLALVDASEFNLYAIELAIAEARPSLPRMALLGDVSDAARVAEIMVEARPDIVLHAAALKHVPLMEANPVEAARVNVCGTRIMVDAAADAEVERFVLISTDKAVNPTNVMGATKRAAELYVQAQANRTGRAFLAVRFGNVLGSSGSVVPLFERQIARGGPVTVTHPDMVRWFMTVEEAAGLVLQAAASTPPPEGFGGQVFVLDMGEPVRIEALARQMIRLKGREPDRDISIIHTGLRPGEKLREEVFYEAEEVRPSAVEGLLIARAEGLPLETLAREVDDLAAGVRLRDRHRVLKALSRMVPAFTGR